MGIFGVLSVLLVVPVSVYLNHTGVNMGPGVLGKGQKLTYPYVRNMWNGQRECVALDPELVYKPALGACHFQNIEFDTVVTFSETGRSHEGLPASGAPIAVIGDSHAMGWGVGDDQTFAYYLQAATGRPVFNLGVGSYATERSLRRLFALPEYADVKTIVLQYSDNDLNENRNFPIDPARWLAVFEEKFAEKDLRERTYFDKLSFTYPLVTSELFQRLWEIPLEMLGFEPSVEPSEAPAAHSPPLQDVLSAFGEQLAGREIILFYVNGYGGQIADLNISLDDIGVPVTYLNLGLEPGAHFFVLDDHLNPAGHKFIADRVLEVLAR